MRRQASQSQSEYIKGKTPNQYRNYRVDVLFSLKDLAINHLKEKKYPQAITYFNDILSKINQMFNQTIKSTQQGQSDPSQQVQTEPLINSEQMMEKIIVNVKLPTHKNLTLCYLKEKMYENCIIECQQVIKVQPNNVKILYRYGQALLNLDNLNEAEKYLRRGYLLDPKQKQFMKALYQVENRRKQIKRKYRLSNPQQKSWLESLLNCLFLPILIIFGLFSFGRKSVVQRNKNQ